MINPFKDVNWQPVSAELKSFSRSMLIGFSVLAIVFGISSFNLYPFVIFLGVGCLLFILQFIEPLNLLAYKIIFMLSCLMGLVVANLILIVFYYAVFCSISMTVRLCTGRDPLQLKKPVESNWQTCQQKKELSRYLKQY